MPGAVLEEARERAWGLLAHWVGRERERGRAFLFLPVAYGAGILLYFAAPDEPLLAAAAAAFAATLLLAWRTRRHAFGGFLACALAGLAGGFAVAALRTALLAHPVLGEELRYVRITAWVEAVERRESGDRLTLRLIGTEPAALAPAARVRVSSRSQTGAKPGLAVALPVRLRPPADPVAPGLYDFGREAYFAGIAASGFVLGRLQPVEAGPPPWPIVWRARLDEVRSAISERIRTAVPGPTGAIADALVTGKRDGIPERLNEAMRAAGTYHILSISGFHMALVAALVFALVRGGFALVPALALRHRVKAWAALVALAVSTGYLVISGAEVATQRSWIMVAIVLIGVALERGALTLRTLALAALAVMTLSPESLLGPSFQMSFAATLALVSGYALVRPWAERNAADPLGWGRTVLAVSNGVLGLAMSSFLASLATTPYAAFHFNVVQLYGVPGNLIGAPIVEFVVMPLEILALMLWPFGWDRPVWELAGSAIGLFVRSSEWVASWPGGTVAVPSFGSGALLLLSAGLLVIGLLSTPLRLLGVPLVLGGLAGATVHDRPLLAIDAEGRTVAARGPDGRLRIVSPHASRFTVARWLAADGDRRAATDASLREGVRCDPLGCAMILADGRRLAFAREAEAVADDCREAALVVTRHPVPPRCQAAAVLLGALRWTGAVTLHRDGAADRIRTARAPTGHRPWHRPRPGGAPIPLLRPPGAAAAVQAPPPAEPQAPDEGDPDQ